MCSIIVVLSLICLGIEIFESYLYKTISYSASVRSHLLSSVLLNDLYYSFCNLSGTWDTSGRSTSSESGSGPWQSQTKIGTLNALESFWFLRQWQNYSSQKIVMWVGFSYIILSHEFGQNQDQLAGVLTDFSFCVRNLIDYFWVMVGLPPFSTLDNSLR